MPNYEILVFKVIFDDRRVATEYSLPGFYFWENVIECELPDFVYSKIVGDSGNTLRITKF